MRYALGAIPVGVRLQLYGGYGIVPQFKLRLQLLKALSAHHALLPLLTLSS